MKIYWWLILILIIGIALAFFYQSADEKIIIETNFEEDEIVDSLEIENRILNKVTIVEDEIVNDLPASDYIETLKYPNRVFPLIKKFCDHEDRDIRLNALNALDPLTSIEAKLQYVKFLDDSDDEIKVEACRSLMYEKSKEILTGILKSFENNDIHVRSTCAYIAGNIGNENIINKLDSFYQKEKDLNVKRDISLAMAKLGDTMHIKQAYDRLNQKDALSRREALEGIKYIDKKGFEKELLKMLDDEGQAYKIDPRNGKYSRLKDASLNVIAKLYNPPLSFDHRNKNTYSDEEIEEVKTYLTSVINQ